MRTWLKRIALALVALLGLALLTGFVYERWSRFRVARTLEPPGRLVEVQGRNMHLHCLGEGAPTVVLEAGMGPDGSSSWLPILDDIASETRVCAYDRAGILWSEAGETPRDAQRIAGELEALLTAGGESAPYVLVGHSLGGPLVRVYAERNPRDVVGMVLVDASHPEQVERFPPEVAAVMESMLPSPLVMRMAANLGVMRWMVTRQGDGAGEGTDVVASLMPRSVSGLLGETEGLDLIMAQAGQTSDLGDLPLAVLTAGQQPDPLPPGVTEEMWGKMNEVWMVLQEELAALSTSSSHRIVDNATHYVHHDRPDVVVEAIKRVIDEVRGDSQRPPTSTSAEETKSGSHARDHGWPRPRSSHGPTRSSPASGP